VRLLRLGNSYDADPSISPADNKVLIADQILERETGEAIETTSRVIWPDPGLPGLVEKWLDRYQPDAVFLVVSSYWFTFASVPLSLEHRFGRFGLRLGEAGEGFVRRPRVARSRSVGLARSLVRTTVGKGTHFTPEEVIERMETCIRRIVAREDIALAVRGPRVAFATEDSPAAKSAAEKRRLLVHRRISKLCEQLHIPYMGWDSASAAHDRPGEFQSDLIHGTVAFHAETAEAEAATILAAWRQRGI
jgi:hypothetical protein